MVKIAIIGGTGLDDPAFLYDRTELPAPYDTPYGKSTNLMVAGKLNGIDVVLVARHGKGHRSLPSCVNYRANIYTIAKILQCDAIVATNAVGSLRGDLHKIGDLVIVDDFIDYTARDGSLRGPQTFYDGQPGHLEGLMHAPMFDAFSPPLRKALLDAAKAEEITAHDGATCVVIEGPRFSSRAEHNMFRAFGGHIVNMTMVPEVCLAKELAIPFAVVAIITDVDSGSDVKAQEDPVSHDFVVENLKKHSQRMTVTIARAVVDIAQLDLKSMNKPMSLF